MNKQDPLKLPRIDHAGVGQRLEALRKAIGISKAEFAASFGCDASSYSKIIQPNTKKPLHADWGYAISVRWGVGMDFLYRGSLGDLPDKYLSAIMSELKAQ